MADHEFMLVVEELLRIGSEKNSLEYADTCMVSHYLFDVKGLFKSALSPIHENLTLSTRS